eukprot:Nk52_evm10s2612 gene=Nk52_evmTU10s2612
MGASESKRCAKHGTVAELMKGEEWEAVLKGLQRGDEHGGDGETEKGTGAGCFRCETVPFLWYGGFVEEEEGWVDYQGLLSSKEGQRINRGNQYIACLTRTYIPKWALFPSSSSSSSSPCPSGESCNCEAGRKQLLCFYLNAYNALTLAAMCEEMDRKGIKGYDNRGLWAKFCFFMRRKHCVGMKLSRGDNGEEESNAKLYTGAMSLYHLENSVIRKVFADEPRVHFYLNCGSRGCPRLSRVLLEEGNLEEELERRTKLFINTHGGVRLEEEEDDSQKKGVRRVKTLWLSSIFKWYEKDFAVAGGVVQFVQRYHLPLQQVMQSMMAASKGGGGEADAKKDKVIMHECCKEVSHKIRYMDYDWSLNDRKEEG